jgi:hypothetical protein
MKRSTFLALTLCLALVSVARGQDGKPIEERVRPSGRASAAEPDSPTMAVVLSQGNQTTEPRVIKFGGVLADSMGRPLSGEVEVTFALYKNETDEEPLWKESQNVTVDNQGGYTALIGSTQSAGIPVELFRSDDARWLGVQIQGEPQRPRILLVSVPYALKAVEAEKLGGKSISDFVLSETLGDQVRQVIQAQGQVAVQPILAGTTTGKQSATNGALTPQLTPSGPMFPPSTFSGTTSNQIVSVQQKGSGSGLVATTASSTGNSGVVGLATSTSTSSNQNGVYGQNAGAGAGVAGIATNPSAGVGVYGQGANFAGVFGNSLVTSGFTSGVFGQTASTDGAGVDGSNTAATGFATGVTGFSASSNGNGVFGNATSTSGSANGVLGQTVSPGGSGVSGFNSAATGFTSGVFGDASASANGTGVFGTSVQWVGVGGQATAASGGPAFGVWGDSTSTGGTGVAGFEDAASGFTNGVSGQSVSPNGNGVAGFANAASGFNNGVYGQTASNEGDAVHGDAINSSGNAVGVLGTTVGTGGGIGVWGVSSASSGGSVGVRGDLESPTANGAAGLFLTFSPTSVAGQFANFSRQGLILQGLSGPFDATQKEVFSVDANGNLQISGNLTVSGTKSSIAKLQDGREVALYAVESPENWFEDFGSGEMNNGVAWIPLEASFAEATNATVTYHVFLTANGDSNGLYVSRKTSAGFEVREHGGSASNVAFDYRIVAKRRGYEAIRMAEVQRDTKTSELSRQHLAALVNSGNLKKMGAAKAPQIAPAPRIRPVPPPPNVPPLPKVSVPRPVQPR